MLIIAIYHFQYNKKISLNYSKSAALAFFSKDLKNEFETAVVNEPSVLYCIAIVNINMYY